MPYHQGLLSQRRQSDDLGGLLDPNSGGGLLGYVPIPHVRRPKPKMSFVDAYGGDLRQIGRALIEGILRPMESAGKQIAGDAPVDPDRITDAALASMGLGYGVTGLVGGVPKGALGANVWHGGPNRWMPEPGYPQGRPLLSRVGTGEGAQAYGHGFYSAEAPGVALDYKTRLTDRGGNTVVRGDVGEVNIPTWLANRVENKGIDSAIREWETRIAKMREELPTAHQPWNIESNIDRMSKQLNEMRGIKGKLDIERGHLKKLDIPDEDVAKMLDWDAPLSEQPKNVRDAMARMKVRRKELEAELNATNADYYEIAVHGADKDLTAINKKRAKLRSEIEDQLEWDDPNMTGADFHYRMENKRSSSGEYPQYPRGGPNTSEALRKAGIPGLKYYDQMSRAGSGDWRVMSVAGKYSARDKATGRTSPSFQTQAEVKQWIADKRTRNYVVWDQDVLNRTKILAQ